MLWPMRGRRLLIYDRTCTGARLRPGLTHSWVAGWWLYRGLGRLDASLGVYSWFEALNWLAQQPGPIHEIQYWGHGKWGELYVEQDCLDLESLSPDSSYAPALDAIASKLLPTSLLWLRTCETFGAHKGQAFAAALSQRMGCRVAGHTYIIGPWQSGLHSLLPGQAPYWPPDEGLALGTPDDPIKALWSERRAPNTVHCLTGQIPAGF